mmetsp:Transcript_136300/g.236996  ORF Transcript_136300/g.236996 Transcript_136300/m.236996 type:complete len:202 (+) Transcript_136300:346-951(+)
MKSFTCSCETRNLFTPSDSSFCAALKAVALASCCSVATFTASNFSFVVAIFCSRSGFASSIAFSRPSSFDFKQSMSCFNTIDSNSPRSVQGLPRAAGTALSIDSSKLRVRRTAMVAEASFIASAWSVEVCNLSMVLSAPCSVSCSSDCLVNAASAACCAVWAFESACLISTMAAALSPSIDFALTTASFFSVRDFSASSDN